MHSIWNVDEPKKRVVERFLRLYIEEWVDQGVISKDQMWFLWHELTVIYNKSPDGTQNDSIMLGNTVEINWVDDQTDASLVANCKVLSQEVAHYVLWKLGRPWTIWHEEVHKRWHQGHNMKFIMRYWSWRYFKPLTIILYGLYVHDL